MLSQRTLVLSKESEHPAEAKHAMVNRSQQIVSGLGNSDDTNGQQNEYDPDQTHDEANGGETEEL